MEVVERDGPDVVLLDINLPDMDGIALLRKIQARPCPPPVVMLTVTTIRQYPFKRGESAFSAQSSGARR